MFCCVSSRRAAPPVSPLHTGMQVACAAHEWACDTSMDVRQHLKMLKREARMLKL